ncbi:MAG TPA: hypothetical protein VFY40_08040, partial [Blastocatellia bacterium]|nr:hypothetical protein [Blastocatellia bacterium]
MRSNFFSLWPKPLWAACLCLAFFGAGPWRQTEAQAQTNSQPAAQLRQAPEPPTEPILRVETGMHTAKINRIAVDAAGRYLVTGSNDKTARVWELATGRLLRVLRPPIGSGFEGMINAVAITPDGRYVAVAGETGAQWSDREIDRENRYSIYVFNRESGAMWNSFRQISLGRLSNAVLSMAFSPDGKKLVATIAGKGVRIIDRIHTDYGAGRDDPEKYNGYEINGIDFDRAGRMATTCTDGYLRLYDKDVDFVRKVRAPGGERPYAVRFSPDGSKLAVGYDDSTRVDVLDGDSLEELYKASASGVRNGDLRAVAWSADGSALYAGGGWHNEKGEYLIRRWAEAGRGRHQDLVAAGDTIMDLAPSEDGGVIFGTREPSWGVFSAKGARVRFVGRETADYRDNQGGFVANETGGVVGFSYESSGKSPARFSVADRQLNPGLGDGASLRPPRVDGLPISDWKDSQTPALKGQTKLKLFAGEYSRSLAVAPDAQRFLLAGDRSMRLFDQNGNELWVNEIPASAGSVNISGDGKLAIAALADGAIRWYRMSDGKELLAFFPHKDRKRWALWTPSGYYDCSPGAENLIGWHVNRDKYKAADFYPAGRFRNTYYRPDVISRILETGDEAEALKLA